MKILRDTDEVQELLFIPRIQTHTVDLVIRGEFNQGDIVYPNLKTTIKEGYTSVYLTIDLDQNKYYSLDVLFDNELIYRDRIFCTNQDLNIYTNNVGNRVTYKAFTDQDIPDNNFGIVQSQFINTVLSSGGILELCDEGENTDMNNLSIWFRPEGYKTGVLYNYLPYDPDNSRSIHFSFSRSGNTATRINPDNNYEIMGSNVPRLDNYKFNCPTLLLEPESQNKFDKSGEFDAVDWILSSDATSQDPIVTPDFENVMGLSAAKIQFRTNTRDSSYASLIGQTVNSSSTLPSSVKCLIRSLSGNQEIVLFQAGIRSSFMVTEEWSFVEFNYQATFDFPALSGIQQRGNNIITNGEFSVAFLQGEFLVKSTSYMPTNVSNEVRGIEVINNAGDSLSINSREGRLILNCAALFVYDKPRLICLSDGTDQNRICLGFDTSNNIRAFVVVGGVLQIDLLSVTTDSLNLNNYELSFRDNDSKLFINDVEVASTTSGTMPDIDVLNELSLDGKFVGTEFEGYIKEIKLYNKSR